MFVIFAKIMACDYVKKINKKESSLEMLTKVFMDEMTWCLILVLKYSRKKKRVEIEMK